MDVAHFYFKVNRTLLTINIKREGNILNIESTRDKPDEPVKWIGEIQIDVHFPNIGRGYYKFVRKYKGSERWGILEMYRKDYDTILVHRRYFYEDGNEISFAFIWKRI
jgi:hypothetical protein